ncbi:MAG: beta-propeller fold lactonase family protein [Planctomycetota bacterium]|jgi:YVTN family beta-propeller protein
MHVLLLTLLLATGPAGAEDTELPVYVGQSVCHECHGPGHQGGACTIPPNPNHARAFEALTKTAAAEIAALSGIPEEPQRSLICLGCHTTAAEEGPRWTAETFNIADGVQCEACHGAGSMHADAYRKPAPDASDQQARLLRPVDRWVCGICHRKRPSHQAVLEEGYRRSPINQLYKTPVNLATSPDGKLLYVVCEHSNSLLVLDPAEGKVVSEIEVGLRPHDVAVSPDGSRLYVTNRLSDSLMVVDANEQKVAAEIPVGDEPHGVLTDTTGRWLFVLNTEENSISVIDTQSLTEVRRLAAGRGPWSLALTPDGQSLYATSVRPDLAPFREPHRSEITMLDAGAGVVINRPVAYGANMLKGIACVPAGPHRGTALFVMMRAKDLVPATRLAQGWVITNGLGVVWADGRVDQVLLDEPHDYFPDPNDVAVSPDGRHALVTSGGADRIAVVDVAALLQTITNSTPHERAEVLPNHLGVSGRFVVKYVDVGSNPRGVAFSPDGRFAYVANALDDSVTVIETAGFSVAGEIDLGGPDAVTELRRGEKLFHNAEITFCRQFSCQSCHPDGHVNGLTIDIEADGVGMKPVDNRTLRGILDTSPFKWEGTNPSLERQCGPRLAVFFTRLAPFTPSELTALVRYMCTIERPPNRYRLEEGLTSAQYRGKLVFDRTVDNLGQPMAPEDRCITCHNGPYKTAQTKTVVETTMWFDAPVNLPVQLDDVYNAREYGQLGLFIFADSGIPPARLDVPHLNNIYDSAPYLHNGSAATLEEIWTRLNMLEGHGLTSDLTRRQFNDLMAYLRAL